jgi:uncharacterized protein YbcV (DUF1398 family)
MGYQGFLKIRARKQFREAKNRKFYLMVLQNNVFHNILYLAATTNKSLSFLTLVTHKGPFRIVRTNSVCPL